MALNSTDKNRYWACIIYPESLPLDYLTIINDWHIPVCISPLHTPEPTSVSEGKEHYHLILKFDGPTTQKYVSKIVADLNGTIPTQIISPSAYTRYLTHLDDPNKQQFINDDGTLIKPLYMGGYPYDKLIDESGSKLVDMAIGNAIFDYIKNHNIISYQDIMDYARHYNQEWFEYLFFRGSWVIDKYIKSHSYMQSVAAENDKNKN